MYYAIRMVIGLFLFILLNLGIVLSKIKYKRVWSTVWSIVSFILICGALPIALGNFPVEDYFITFKSPEAAYEYSSSDKSNIALVVEGDYSDFIVARNDNGDSTYIYSIIPKTADGWKVGLASYIEKVATGLNDGVSIDVHRYRDTSDYFITIYTTAFCTDDEETTVSDEYNTRFYPLERYSDYKEKTLVDYYAHLTDFDPEYSVIVNGSKVEWLRINK